MDIDEEDKDESVVHNCKHESMPRHEISIEDGEDVGASLPLQQCEDANTSSRTNCLNSNLESFSKKDTDRIADYMNQNQVIGKITTNLINVDEGDGGRSSPPCHVNFTKAHSTLSEDANNLGREIINSTEAERDDHNKELRKAKKTKRETTMI